MKQIFLLFITTSMFFVLSCNYNKINKEEEMENNYAGCISLSDTSYPVCEDYVNERLATYVPVRLESDISNLSDNEMKILDILWQVADIMDDIYWKQTIGNKNAFLSTILDENTKAFAKINYGPWDRLNDNISFIEGIGEKPTGANFYPIDMTKEEFDAFGDENKTSGYTLIRRDASGNLKTVWYHDAYKSELTKAHDLLMEAASYADDQSLKNYFTLRAEAFLSSDYHPSDSAWMTVKNTNIDFVAGPIENYEDALNGYKCSFESFILIKDVEWSKKLAKYSAMLPELQTKLPVSEDYKKDVPGTQSDINVYDAIYYRGDCNAGSKTIAINLPNDEEVHKTSGSRKFQLKNSMEAKFNEIVLPISRVVLDESQWQYVKFDAFFENVTFHEVGHAMGVKSTINGKQTVREALKEQYSALEEAKADIMGLFLVTQLNEMGEFSNKNLMDNYVTFFAGIFRSCRFGAASAHGKANMLAFNYFEKEKAFQFNPKTGKYKVDFEKMKVAVNNWLSIILTLQGDGNYETVKSLINKDAVIKTQLQKDLDIINSKNIPVDIVFIQGLSNKLN